MKKQIKKKTLLIWDIENISYKYKEFIFQCIPYIPEKQYVVTKKELNTKWLKHLAEDNIKVFKATKHKTADDKILDILKISKLNVNTIIIASSDSDFVNFVLNNVSNTLQFHFIMYSQNSKRILMTSELDNPNIKYSSFGEGFKKRQRRKRKNKWSALLYPKKIGEPLQIEELKNKQKESVAKKNLVNCQNFSELEKNELLDFLSKNNVIIDNIYRKEYIKINGKLLYVSLLEWFFLEKKRIENKHRFSYSKTEISCDICGEKNNLKKTFCFNIKYCKKCELEWVQEQKHLQTFKNNFDYISEINHENRFLDFFNKKKFEILINGKIIYFYKKYNDILQLEYDKIKIPELFFNANSEDTIKEFFSEDIKEKFNQINFNI